MVLSQTWSASQAEIGINSCSSCRYHERLDTGNDLIGPFSVDDFFGSGPIQRSHGNIRIGLSKVVVSPVLNCLETRQLYREHVPMFESMEEHLNHGIAGFNINLCDGSSNQFRCDQVVHVRIEIFGTTVNPDIRDCIHTEALRLGNGFE